MKRDHAGRFVAMIGALALGDGLCATPATAQFTDAMALARMDSASICPAVTVSVERGIPGGLISMTPIAYRVEGRDLALSFSASVLPSGTGTIGMIMFAAIEGSSGRYEHAHDITVIGDDSIRIAASSKYDRLQGTRFESVTGRVPSYDLARLANAKKITVTLGTESYPLTRGQIQAVHTFVGEMDKPISAREVPTGCVGPNPLDLQWRWAGATGPRPSSDTSIHNARVRSPTDRDPVYFEFQVEKPASVAGTVFPEYPQILKSDGVEGSVLAQFVVLEDGTADMETFRVLKSDAYLFTSAVRDAVPKMRFIPAEVGWRKVRQLVQQPFNFRLGGARDTTVSSQIRIRRALETMDSSSFRLPASKSQHVYTESQVDKPVRMPSGDAVTKQLPPAVVATFGGEEVLEFVVNADGQVAPETVRVIRESDPRVASVARDTKGLHFLPAQLHGERVRQIVQIAIPVTFIHTNKQ